MPLAAFSLKIKAKSDMASDKILCSLSWYVLCYVVPSVMYIVVHAFVYTEQSLLMLSLQLWFLNNALADRRMYRSYYIFSFFSPCVLLSSVFLWFSTDVITSHCFLLLHGKACSVSCFYHISFDSNFHILLLE